MVPIGHGIIGAPGPHVNDRWPRVPYQSSGTSRPAPGYAIITVLTMVVSPFPVASRAPNPPRCCAPVSIDSIVGERILIELDAQSRSCRYQEVAIFRW